MKFEGKELGPTPPKWGGCWFCHEARNGGNPLVQFSFEWDAWYHPKCHYIRCLEEGEVIPV